MKYGSNVIINLWTFFNSKWKSLFTFSETLYVRITIIMKKIDKTVTNSTTTNKAKTVTNSTTTNKTNNYLTLQIIEH